MAGYDPLIPTGLDRDLIPKSVRADFFKETLLTTDLRRFMGSSQNSIIQVDYKDLGDGDSYTMSFSKEIDYTAPIVGNFAQVSGRGQDPEFYSDSLIVRQQAFADKLASTRFMRLDTPIKIFDRLRPLLLTANVRNLTYSILKAATIANYPVLTAGGPTANRVVYGAKAYPGDGFIQTGINSMTGGSGYNQDGLSVAGIRKLRDYAVLGGVSFEADKRISPTQLTTSQGAWVPRYVYFMDTVSYRSLCQDPDWKNYWFRGTVESSIYQPSGLSGSFFKGAIDDVEIYECPELGKFQQLSTDAAVRVSWNLFLGAQAFMLVWGEEPWFDLELTNHKLIAEMASIQIRGEKAIKFPSFTNKALPVESGILHHFVSITGL